MNNRISPLISGLPKRHHRDLITFLQSRDDFQALRTKMHISEPRDPGNISASMSVAYLHCSYRFKGYDVTVLALLGEIYITCEKI